MVCVWLSGFEWCVCARVVMSGFERYGEALGYEHGIRWCAPIEHHTTRTPPLACVFVFGD